MSHSHSNSTHLLFVMPPSGGPFSSQAGMDRFNHQLSYRGDAAVLLGDDGHIQEQPDGTWAIQVYLEGNIGLIRDQLERFGFSIVREAKSPKFYFERYQAGMRFRVSSSVELRLKILRPGSIEEVTAEPFTDRIMTVVDPWPKDENRSAPTLVDLSTWIGASLSDWLLWESILGISLELISDEED